MVYTHENSLLWEIVHNEVEPSYLFGTIHMICDDEFYIPSKVRTALLNCRQYVTEIDFGSMEEMQQMQDSAAANDSLYERVSPYQYGVMEYLLKKYDMDIGRFEFSSFIEIISHLSIKSMPCNQATSVDMELYKLARFNGLETGGLETVAGQIDIAEETITAAYLIDILKGDHYRGLMNEMLEAYKQENLNKLYEVLTHKHMMDENMRKTMLINRNADWTKQIIIASKQKPVFFAFGAAHLLGKTGVVSLLRKKGISLKPVF